MKFLLFLFWGWHYVLLQREKLFPSLNGLCCHVLYSYNAASHFDYQRDFRYKRPVRIAPGTTPPRIIALDGMLPTAI